MAAFQHIYGWIVGTGPEWVVNRHPLILGPSRKDARKMLLLEAGMDVDRLAGDGVAAFAAPCCVKVDCCGSECRARSCGVS